MVTNRRHSYNHKNNSIKQLYLYRISIMKKIIFLLLCTVSMYGQISTGQEQEFDYGIKNNSTQTITTPTYLGTVGADGTYGKITLENLQGKKAFLSTGLIKNGLISANGDPTKFN